MSDITIPPAALEAAFREWHKPNSRWTDVIVAALNAWPGMLPVLGDEDFPRKIVPHDAIILPLTEGDGQ